MSEIGFRKNYLNSNFCAFLKKKMLARFGSSWTFFVSCLVCLDPNIFGSIFWLSSAQAGIFFGTVFKKSKVTPTCAALKVVFTILWNCHGELRFCILWLINLYHVSTQKAFFLLDDWSRWQLKSAIWSMTRISVSRHKNRDTFSRWIIDSKEFLRFERHMKNERIHAKLVLQSKGIRERREGRSQWRELLK